MMLVQQQCIMDYYSLLIQEGAAIAAKNQKSQPETPGFQCFNLEPTIPIAYLGPRQILPDSNCSSSH
jgi:hypothetical protein